MATVDRWQLPDGVEEVLPEQAAAVEHLRRALLDLLASWGYQLVIPPLMEFTESLLVGLGADLDLLTFKMTDQLSGRSLGVRADITPQVARIDAHSLGEAGISRLCYAGSTLHTQPKTLMASRSPIQLGAELYGDTSEAADLEIIGLMLATLAAAGLENITLDLGHVGVYNAVLKSAALNPEQEATIFDALQRKSRPDLELALEDVSDHTATLVLGLLDLHGDGAVLARARELFSADDNGALAAVEKLQAVADSLTALHKGISIYFDLAELRGYHYHTGIVFAAYVPGYGQAVANGGRYNNVGEVYGRARPATGFASDLKALTALSHVKPSAKGAISKPNQADPALDHAVERLREAGEIVINRLAENPDTRCDRELVSKDGEWVVVALNS